MRQGAEGVIGLRKREIAPGKPSGRALGIKLPRFEPGGALERGAEGVIGLRNAKIDPEKPLGRG